MGNAVTGMANPLVILSCAPVWVSSFLPLSTTVLATTKICMSAPYATRRTVQGEDEDRVLIVASRLPVVAYREGDVGERMMSRFYTKLKQQAGDDGKGSSSSPFDSAKSARSGGGGAGVGVMAGADRHAQGHLMHFSSLQRTPVPAVPSRHSNLGRKRYRKYHHHHHQGATT